MKCPSWASFDSTSNHVLIESNFGDGMFAALLEPVMPGVYPCTLEEVRATGQKERRIIDDLEPVLNQHRLIVDARAAKADAEACKGDEKEQKYSLLYQLTRVTKDRGCLRHDDRLDALAHGVRRFLTSLRVDAEAQEREHLKKLDEARWAGFFSLRADAASASTSNFARSRHRSQRGSGAGDQ